MRCLLRMAGAAHAATPSLPQRRSALAHAYRRLGVHTTAERLKGTAREDVSNAPAETSGGGEASPATATTGSTAVSTVANEHTPLFFDTSVTDDSELQKSNKHIGIEMNSNLPVCVQTRGRITESELLRRVDIQELDEACRMLEVPDAHKYALHTMQSIPEAVVRSIKARAVMYKYAGLEDFSAIKRHANTDAEIIRSAFLGRAIHIQFIHPSHSSCTGSGNSADTAPAATAAPGTTTGGGDGGGAVSAASPSPGDEEQVRKDLAEVCDAVEEVLRRYTCRVIRPFPHELVVDVTHYATFVPLLNVSRRNVMQVVSDVKSYLSNEPPAKEGVAGPPSPKEIEPLSPDVLAAEIARVIRREVLLPRQRRGGGGGAERTSGGDETKTPAHGSTATSPPAQPATGDTSAPAASMRVCIGVATSAVMAKIACDVEAAVVTAKLREALAADSASNAGGASGGTIPLVSIRSFYRHIKTLKESHEFMSTFPVRRVPSFTPAFADLLHRAIGVATCGELYQKRGLLYFCLSRKSAAACHAASMGRMLFEAETHSPLLAPSNLEASISSLSYMASNKIAFVNEDRTAYETALTTVMARSMRSSANFRTICSYFVRFGRLSTRDSIHAHAEGSMRSLHRALYRRGITYGGVRVALAGMKGTSLAEYWDGETTEDRGVEVLHRLLQKLLEKPVNFGKAGRGRKRFSAVILTASNASILPMVPPALIEEAEKLESILFSSKAYISSFVKRKKILKRLQIKRKAKRMMRPAEPPLVFV